MQNFNPAIMQQLLANLYKQQDINQDISQVIRNNLGYRDTINGMPTGYATAVGQGNLQGIPMKYGENYYTGEVDKNILVPNINATNRANLSIQNEYGVSVADMLNAKLKQLQQQNKENK